MGRAIRWLRNLLGGKKETKDLKDHYSYGAEDRREKKRWSFTKSGRESVEAVAPATSSSAVEAAWLRSFYAETEKEQSKHAIAVAAATAAAADAAVAAAQAAVAVVRLTSQGRGTMFGGVHERLAAVKIQTAFRGYLAKKALRALKALVRLQALVRGYLVRRQAAATLHSMQSLIRAQATVRAYKSRNLLTSDQRLLPRRSLERFDESRSEHLSSFHSRRLSASLDNASSGYDRSPKIVEIDTCRPKSRSSRRATGGSPSLLDSVDDAPISSPVPCQVPARISIPDCRNLQDYDWGLPINGDKCRLPATAQSTPRYMSSSVPTPMPVTPAKSVCGVDGAFRRFLNYPNYMANTQSFEAKVRSQSAPKQRPEPAAVGPRKRIPLSEMVESRVSLSGVGTRRSCSQVQEAFNFKSAVVGRLNHSAELGRELERDYYLQRKW